MEKFHPREFVDPQPGMEIGRSRKTELEKGNQVWLQHRDFDLSTRPLDKGHIGHNTGGDHPKTLALEIGEERPTRPALMAKAVKLPHTGYRTERLRIVVVTVDRESHFAVETC